MQEVTRQDDHKICHRGRESNDHPPEWTFAWPGIGHVWQPDPIQLFGRPTDHNDRGHVCFIEGQRTSLDHGRSVDANEGLLGPHAGVGTAGKNGPSDGVGVGRGIHGGIVAMHFVPLTGRYCVVVLPDWLDPNTLRWLILGAMGLLVVAMLMIIRTIQRLAMRVVLLGILAGFGLSLWIQRSDLRDCVDTCECSLYGQDLQVDYDQLPRTMQDSIDANKSAFCGNVIRDG